LSYDCFCMRSSISFLFTKLKNSLFVSARSTSGNVAMVWAMSSKNTVNCFFFVELSLSDLSRDAINLANVVLKSEVSGFFLFETVEEVDSDGDGVCDSAAISSYHPRRCHHHHRAVHVLPPEGQRSYEF